MPRPKSIPKPKPFRVSTLPRLSLGPINKARQVVDEAIEILRPSKSLVRGAHAAVLQIRHAVDAPGAGEAIVLLEGHTARYLRLVEDGPDAAQEPPDGGGRGAAVAAHGAQVVRKAADGADQDAAVVLALVFHGFCAESSVIGTWHTEWGVLDLRATSWEMGLE